MNARESIAYFKSIGVELRPSKMKRQRWWLSVFGDDDGMHFTSLPEIWDYFKGCWAQQHFEDALAAQWTLDAICRYARSESEWRDIERWARDEIECLPHFASEIAEKTMGEAEGCPLPRQWRRAYTKLICPLGEPEFPIFGRILQEKVLALLANETACYQRMPAGSAHDGHGDTAVGR
jgi:hypothetical protein